MAKSAAWSARVQLESPLLPAPNAAFQADDSEMPALMFPTSQAGGAAASFEAPFSAGPASSNLPPHGSSPVFSPPPHLHLPASPTFAQPLQHHHPSPAASSVVWKKGLYERQPFEDNYVDPVLFLQELKKNSNVKAYLYSDIVKDTFVIVQQISFIVVFVYMFALIVSDRIALTTIFAIDAAVLVGGAASFFVLRQEMTVTTLPLESMFQYSQQAVVFCGVVVMLSPVFQTLTVSYTDDTIWALGITAMFMHLLLTDYAYLNAVKAKYEQGVGVNAATFGSILLASRIQSPLFGAALIGFGILCFNLSPIPRHYLKSYSAMAHVGATFLLCGVTMGCLL